MTDAQNTDDRPLELTILRPRLNEAETLAVCVTKARRFLDLNQIEGEVLVADNGSTDGLVSVAEQHGARVVHIPARGYGNALNRGVAAARGGYVIMGDADDSYDFAEPAPFVERLRSGDHLVMGNRFAGGIESGAMPWHHRYVGNPVLSFIGRRFFHLDVRDFHCGPRGFDRDHIESLGLQTSGMEWASELVAASAMAGSRIS